MDGCLQKYPALIIIITEQTAQTKLGKMLPESNIHKVEERQKFRHLFDTLLVSFFFFTSLI